MTSTDSRVVAHGRLRAAVLSGQTAMHLSWTCGRPAVAPALQRGSERAVKYSCYQGIRTGESHSQMEGFQAEGDRPHTPTVLRELQR